MLVMAGYMGRAHYLKADPSLGLLFKLGKHVPIRYAVYLHECKYAHHIKCPHNKFHNTFDHFYILYER